MREASTQSRAAVVTDVTLDRRSDGALVASWTVAGDCEQVDVSWGRSPDGVDHEHGLTVDASSGRVVLPDSAGGPRLYVSVGGSGQGGATVAGTGGAAGVGAVAGERNLGLAGPVNFRDLGGYRTDTGASVRWGRVFRADALILHDEDVEQFAGLGIKTVYDLRSDLERETSPNAIPSHVEEGIDVEILPLIPPTPEGTNPLEGVDLSDGESFLAGLYARVLETSAPNFGRVLTGLADESRLPAVFHCMAGKDRTGMVAAVLLSILGVPEDVVLADYELTGKYRDAARVRESMSRLESRGEMPPEVLAGILRSPGWAMRAALDSVRDRYGDFDSYLTGPGGADPAVPARLRRHLLAT